APASAARRVDSSRKIRHTEQRCAPRQLQMRVAQKPEEILPKNQNTV
ncbi:hypothetical protein A2U01_0119401, partial [Trifolium medium]|nr:hypothetical protein [Trifolium medium]